LCCQILVVRRHIGFHAIFNLSYLEIHSCSIMFTDDIVPTGIFSYLNDRQFNI
jgi:hypothetical protein